MKKNNIEKNNKNIINKFSKNLNNACNKNKPLYVYGIPINILHSYYYLFKMKY